MKYLVLYIGGYMAEPVNPVFNATQFQYLQKMFPEYVLGPEVSEEKMRFYFGQQSVMQAIRERTVGLGMRYPSNSIPSPEGN